MTQKEITLSSNRFSKIIASALDAQFSTSECFFLSFGYSTIALSGAYFVLRGLKENNPQDVKVGLECLGFGILVAVTSGIGFVKKIRRK